MLPNPNPFINAGIISSSISLKVAAWTGRLMINRHVDDVGRHLQHDGHP